MSEYRRYNLTLTVADPSARDRFRALSRPETFREIRPNRSPGQRSAYSVEMTQSEYEAALEDAADPNVNLIVVEPDARGHDSSVVPGATVDTYMAAQDADSLGLTGQGVDVGVIERDYGPMLNSAMSGRIKAAKGFGDGADPYAGAVGHGSRMIGLAAPGQSRAVAAAYDGAASTFAAAVYWMADEIGVDIISISQWFDYTSTAMEDALNHAYGIGILIFGSAGNGTHNDAIPTQNIVFPGSLANVLTISNYRPATDAIDSTSNYGPKIWAAAAGSSLSVYDPSGNVIAIDNGGTSAATALAAGIAARLMSGGRSAANVKNYLASNARKTGASPIYEGNGVLQLATAENQLQQDKPYPQNLDGSIPLPDGGILTQPGQSDTSLPAGTTVYPEGTPTYDNPTIGLPDGGVWQGGNNAISGNSTITPVPPDGAGDPDPGVCG